VQAFATEAKRALDEVSKEASPEANEPAVARKRAATIPPIKTVSPPPKTTLAGPLTAKLPARPRADADDESAATHPRLQRAHDDDDPRSSRDETRPHLKLPSTSSLADRIDAQLGEDFGADTPVSAPTRAELQALLGGAIDPTRIQSAEEIERLNAGARRTPTPTAEVDEHDIEAAIELAPPARRNAIGVAKKKPE
jgi:hypothetical protein